MYKFKIHLDRFEQITNRGVKANATPSEDTKQAVVQVLAALSAYEKTAIMAKITGRKTEGLTDEIEKHMTTVLNKYDDCCTLDCALVS